MRLLRAHKSRDLVIVVVYFFQYYIKLIIIIEILCFL